MIAEKDFTVIKKDVKQQPFKSNILKPAGPLHVELRDTFQEHSRMFFVYAATRFRREMPLKLHV